MYFNNNPISSTTLYKHLGMVLDEMLSYKHHLNFVINKVKKAIGLLHKFQQILLRQNLITICKYLIRPHLDHSYIFYDRPLTNNFTKILNLFNITWP